MYRLSAIIEGNTWIAGYQVRTDRCQTNKMSGECWTLELYVITDTLMRANTKMDFVEC